MSNLDSRTEALAEAIVFAHEAEAPPLPPPDRLGLALEQTAALTTAALAPATEVPARLQARLLTAGLQFCAEVSPRVAQPRAIRRWPTALAFAAGLAAGVLVYAQLAPGPAADQPPAARRAALLAAAATDVQWPWQAGPSPLCGKVHGDVVWSSARQEGYLTFRGLPPLDPEHRYQLWIVDGKREGAPVDGGVFAVTDPSHDTVVPVRATLPIGRPAGFVVTVETKAGVVVSKQEHVVAIAGL
jgi:hypothetical protein